MTAQAKTSSSTDLRLRLLMMDLLSVGLVLANSARSGAVPIHDLEPDAGCDIDIMHVLSPSLVT